MVRKVNLVRRYHRGFGRNRAIETRREKEALILQIGTLEQKAEYPISEFIRACTVPLKESHRLG